MSDSFRDSVEIELTVNGKRLTRSVDPRLTLADFLREDLDLTGTKLGCEHGACGACSVLMDDLLVRSCLTLAVQAGGTTVRTVESISAEPRGLRLRESFKKHHALQCGFCTSGVLVAAYHLLEEGEAADAEDVREELNGNLCRCTGYQGIVAAVLEAGAEVREEAP
jgi:aerobic carbon-monoxide dehydrogenase small subunit